MNPNGQGAAGRVIETASATTSPDNANSDNRVYLIVAIALIAIMVASSAIGGCMSKTLKSLYYLIEDDVAEIDWESTVEDGYGYGYGYGNGYDINYDFDLDDPDGLDEFYRILDERDDSGSGRY